MELNPKGNIKMRLFTLVLALLFVPVVAYSEESMDKDQLIQLADEYAKCMGFQSASAAYAAKENLGDNVIETFKGAARGSKIMATHLLSVGHSNGEKPPTEYFEYVETVAGNYELRVSALWDIADSDSGAMDTLNEYGQRCGELSKFTGEYMNKLRKDRLLPK